MILDPDSYALVNAIDDLLEDTPVGEIKPELMESCSRSRPTRARNSARPGRSCARCDVRFATSPTRRGS